MMLHIAPDYLEELALIRISQMQREKLNRWHHVLEAADEHEIAAELLAFPERFLSGQVSA